MSYIFANILCLYAFLCFFVTYDYALYLYITSLCYCAMVQFCILVLNFFLCTLYVVLCFLIRNFWSSTLFNFVLYLAFLTYFDLNVTGGCFEDETRVWRKHKSMKSLFTTTGSMSLLVEILLPEAITSPSVSTILLT